MSAPGLVRWRDAALCPNKAVQLDSLPGWLGCQCKWRFIKDQFLWHKGGCFSVINMAPGTIEQLDIYFDAADAPDPAWIPSVQWVIDNGRAPRRSLHPEPEYRAALTSFVRNGYALFLNAESAELRRPTPK